MAVMLNRLKIALQVAYVFGVAAIKANNPGYAIPISVADRVLRNMVSGEHPDGAAINRLRDEKE